MKPQLIQITETIPFTKVQQSDFVESLISQIENGEINPVEAVVKAKALNETLKAFLKDERVNEYVLNECDKYGKGETPSFAGATVSVRPTGTKYDYMNCGDPEYANILKQEQEISKARKEREKYLSAITKPKTEFNGETGEIYTLNPPVKTAKDSFIITFKKE